MFFKSLALLALLSFGSANAESPSPSPSVSPGHDEGPCMKIREACEAAGYHKGGKKEGKGLHKDCMRPLMHTGPNAAAGVTTVTQDEINQCKAHFEKHHGHDKD